jgi:hypothetical protein
MLNPVRSVYLVLCSMSSIALPALSLMNAKDSVGVSRISKAIFTRLAFNSASTAGRFLTSKPKCFTPCVRKSSDGFFLDSGSRWPAGRWPDR